MKKLHYGFNLIKNNIIHAFGSKGFSSIFLTDYSNAEMNALKTVWPQSKPLLCIFQFLQAVRRWYWNSKNNIKKEDRYLMLHAFRTIVYTEMPYEAHKAYTTTLNTGSNYPL